MEDLVAKTIDCQFKGMRAFNSLAGLKSGLLYRSVNIQCGVFYRTGACVFNGKAVSDLSWGCVGGAGSGLKIKGYPPPNAGDEQKAGKKNPNGLFRHTGRLSYLF